MLQSDSGPCALTANGLFGINPDEKINHRAGCDLLGQRGQRSVVVAARWRRGTGLYRTAPLERGVLKASVTASGTVNPVTQVSGQIRAIHVDFNSEVKGGRPADRRDRPPDL